MEKIIVGRDRHDLKKFGSKATIFIGKHIVGEGEEAHLTNPIYMDVNRPHLVLICGKRGSGKSYDVGVIAEEFLTLPPDIKNNLSGLIIDTMGIYWSMKSPNTDQAVLLKKWGLKPKGIKIKLLVPKPYAEEYNKLGVKIDGTFTLSCSELNAMDWILSFGFSPIDPHGVAIEKAIKKVSGEHRDGYIIQDIIDVIEDEDIDHNVKNALVNRFNVAKDWGVFERKGMDVKTFFDPGGLTILDVSRFVGISAGWSVRNMLLGLICTKIYQKRLVAKKAEEFGLMTYQDKKTIPMIWVMIDEAHQFLPNDSMTAASEALLTIIKQGREPGISLILMTQRPDKLHPDALAQSDIVISHRLTAEADLRALRSIMQSYMLDDINEHINNLPRQKGTAVILDDNSERLYSVQIRPRISWHAGGSPTIVKKKGLFEEEESDIE
ncbi:MAG: ATP-binding protein [Nanoarchaeota archaeon]|nr:ATP-binding protein [Nanoarchaeota archaeon]MBU1135425.1 ATP-binding protein [Nanoarchaeota archaeon]MBU2520464.1 ATP-binding protein [Nanoarchaeota archaeon]